MVRFEGCVKIGRDAAVGAAIRVSGGEGPALDLVCDREGRFVLPDLKAGSYEVCFLAHRWVHPLDIPEVPVYRGVLSFPYSTLVRGRVVDSETGQPIPGAQLMQCGANGEIEVTRSDEVGGYTLTRRRGGGGPVVQVQREGYLKTDLSDASGTEVRMTRAAVLEGQMLNSDGKIVSEATYSISLLCPERGPLDSIVRRGRTDTHGRFRIGGLSSGIYQARVVADGGSAEGNLTLRPGQRSSRLWVLAADAPHSSVLR